MYAIGMPRARQKTAFVSVRVTPTVKRLLLGIITAEGLASESEAVAAAIREYAARRRIHPISEDDFVQRRRPDDSAPEEE